MENPKIPEKGFILDQVMHLHINSHELALTPDIFYFNRIDRKEESSDIFKNGMNSALNGLF